MATTATRKLSIGYAETSTKRYPKEPETVVVGETECEGAKFVGYDTIGSGANITHCIFKMGRRYFWQSVHQCQLVELGHTRYNVNDLENCGSWDGLRIDADHADLIDCPLWWQKRGLSETTTGYGRKLTTSMKIDFDGKLRRVYCCCFSNSGTCYFIWNGKRVLVG